ncbi:hypothetical protein C7405_10646 [Paraburkholderia caballeronis]|nr:hypothetical protein C7405_10646 [Paraburkholderia caballeronis]
MKPEPAQSVVRDFERVGIIPAKRRDFHRSSREVSELERILILTIDVKYDYARMGEAYYLLEH